uniref:Uncharacterized protein n=1 Tax=Trichuris muris TaxID=70415 RepID=A0A5S6QS44_TRIMR
MLRTSLGEWNDNFLRNCPRERTAHDHYVHVSAVSLLGRTMGRYYAERNDGQNSYCQQRRWAHRPFYWDNQAQRRLFVRGAMSDSSDSRSKWTRKETCPAGSVAPHLEAGESPELPRRILN